MRAYFLEEESWFCITLPICLKLCPGLGQGHQLWCKTCRKLFSHVSVWICKLTITNLRLRWNDFLYKSFRWNLRASLTPAQLTWSEERREGWFSTEFVTVLCWLAGFLWELDLWSDPQGLQIMSQRWMIQAIKIIKSFILEVVIWMVSPEAIIKTIANTK